MCNKKCIIFMGLLFVVVFGDENAGQPIEEPIVCWIEGGNKSFVKSANECKKKSAGSHISVDEAWLRYAKNEFPNGGENVEYCLRGVKVDSLTWDATTDANTKSCFDMVAEKWAFRQNVSQTIHKGILYLNVTQNVPQKTIVVCNQKLSWPWEEKWYFNIYIGTNGTGGKNVPSLVTLIAIGLAIKGLLNIFS